MNWTHPCIQSKVVRERIIRSGLEPCPACLDDGIVTETQFEDGSLLLTASCLDGRAKACREALVRIPVVATIGDRAVVTEKLLARWPGALAEDDVHLDARQRICQAANRSGRAPSIASGPPNNIARGWMDNERCPDCHGFQVSWFKASHGDPPARLWRAECECQSPVWSALSFSDVILLWKRRLASHRDCFCGLKAGRALVRDAEAIRLDRPASYVVHCSKCDVQAKSVDPDLAKAIWNRGIEQRERGGQTESIETRNERLGLTFGTAKPGSDGAEAESERNDVIGPPPPPSMNDIFFPPEVVERAIERWKKEQEHVGTPAAGDGRGRTSARAVPSNHVNCPCILPYTSGLAMRSDGEGNWRINDLDVHRIATGDHHVHVERKLLRYTTGCPVCGGVGSIQSLIFEDRVRWTAGCHNRTKHLCRYATVVSELSADHAHLLWTRGREDEEAVPLDDTLRGIRDETRGLITFVAFIAALTLAALLIAA